MIDRLKKHHIGIIITENKSKKLEKRFKKKFKLDRIQGTRVMFVYDDDLKIFREYIIKEGRVKNLPLGLAHICYSVKNKKQLQEIEEFISNKKLGFPVTQLEKSGSKECGFVKFFYMKNFNLIELNIESIND
tara:strand:- start:7 stop:402 length:396 start_codon:yes stop_codon:yes gene_type:complete